jgi:uncharacterized membrane protein YccC
VRVAVLDSALLAGACLASYEVTSTLSGLVPATSAADRIISGLWAVIATIIVTKLSYQQSVTAGVSRILGTAAGFAVCLVYLAIWPFRPWAMALLIGLSALIMMLAGRPADAVTAAITTALLLALAGVTPQHAWQQPIRRLADTIVGVAVGVAAAWLGQRLIRPAGDRS